MSRLFNRDFSLIVGPIKIDARTLGSPTKSLPTLRVFFSIEKTPNRDPNRAEVSVYNLNAVHRKTLQEKLPLILQAGYVGNKQQIFFGDISFIDSRREGSNWVTTIEAGDGQKNYSSKRMSVSFGPGTTLQQLLIQAATALQILPGNSITKFGTPLRGLIAFKKGVSVVGRVSRILDKYVTSAGYQWSIQDGQLQVLSPDETLVESVTILNKATGLIGSPEQGEDGTVKARSLLQPAIVPGGRVILESEMVKGTFKAEQVSYIGDTWGPDWYTEFEGKEAALI